METLEIIGFVCAVLIGIVVGLLGGGGAILAVPVLVYLLGFPTDEATAYSLFVVAATALAGSIRYIRKKLVNYTAAFFFLVPSVIFVYLTRLWLVQIIPQEITFRDLVVSKKFVLMVLFALLMIGAGTSMLRKISADAPQNEADKKWKLVTISACGCLVGFLAGLLGAGGGFLIVPVLVLFVKLHVKVAVGTSLTVIAGQSLFGFLGDVHASDTLDWSFLLAFTSLSLLGMVLGTVISGKLRPENIRRIFGVFTIMMGIVILAAELLAL